MRRTRRHALHALAGAAALAALPRAAWSSPCDAAALPARRDVLGVGTAGTALTRKAEALGLFSARDFVRVMDRDAGADWPFACDTLRFPSAASGVREEMLIITALGGRGGRMAAMFAQSYATHHAATPRQAVLVMPYAFENARHARAHEQLRTLTPAFHHVVVLHNEDALRDGEELWSAVHERSNEALWAALRTA